jgi:PAS domain S-box-containing protein
LVRALVEAVPAMLACWDATQRCLFANRAYARWFGVSPDALIGMHLRSLLGPELYRLQKPHIDAVLRGESQQLERELRNPRRGPPRHTLVTYAPYVVDGVVHGFFVMVTDITDRKQREDERKVFVALMENSSDFIGISDPTGKPVYINTAGRRMVGVSDDFDIEQTQVADYYPESERAFANDVIVKETLERGRWSGETRFEHRKTGKAISVSCEAFTIRDPDDGRLLGMGTISRDITEAKRIDQELRVAEAKASGILSISADAIISIDEKQRITLFNEGAEKIFGYTKAEVVGAPVEMLIPKRLRERHRDHVARFARGIEPARRMGEGRAAIVGRRKNGDEFPADGAISNLEVGGRHVLTVALRDVSERTRIEKEQTFLARVGPALASSLGYEETLTKITELAVTDLADFCVIEVLEPDGSGRRKSACRDPAWAWLCDMFDTIAIDHSRPYPLGIVIDTKRPLLMQKPSPEKLASLAQSEEHLRALLAVGLHSMLGVPLFANDKVIGAFALISNSPSRTYGPDDVPLAEGLARRAALAVENARLYRAAQRATQARDDVLGIVAHDLRNPLTSIILAAKLLHRPDAPPRSEHAAGAIERAATRMNRLIEDLLDVTRMEAGRLSVEARTLPARPIVESALDAHRQLASSASVELRVEIEDDVHEVFADGERLLQVFENLIGNALKFTPRGGSVTVGARVADGDVCFSVADTGGGIAAANIPRLFDRFWQLKRAERRGAGLGLPIAKGLVEAHGGRIWVESTVGRGTTFFFTIPTAKR